ncbi:MAG TPA: hypothetical protein VL337_09485 [Acidimicrobiales bacterium]|nr:hypothetical protein [Acidimicrobiales bacterium]
MKLSRRTSVSVPLVLLVTTLVAVSASAVTTAHEPAGEESEELAAGLEWFGGQRLGPAQALDPAAFGAAAGYATQVAANASAQWTELGPYRYAKDDRRYVSAFSNNGSGSGYNTGRITGVAASPDGQALFATGAGGGIWRATDSPGFQTWQPVGDALPTTATGAIAVAPGGSGYTVYVGTGEAGVHLDSYAGAGVFSSTDGGSTWGHVGDATLDGAAFFKMVFANGHLFAGTNKGLYRLDGGAWTRVIGDDRVGSDPITNAEVLNSVTDVAARPGTNEMVAVRGWRAGSAKNGLYLSKDGGQSFSGPLQPKGYVPQKAQGRGSVAYSSDGKKLYVLVEDAAAFNSNGAPHTLLEGIYLSKTGSTDGPFVQIASPSVLGNSGSAMKPGEIGPGYQPGVQGWYNQWLLVDPADAGHVYAGLEEVYETTDGGGKWVTAAPYWNLTLPCFDANRADWGGCPNTTHSDQHAATIANGQIVVGNDGGVFSRSLDVHTAGGGWTDHNAELGTTQFYYADSGFDPTNGGKLAYWGGLQDNGTAKLILDGGTLKSPFEASEPFGGDGGATVVNPTNAAQVMTEYTDLSPAVTTDGGRTWTDVTPGDPSPLFIAPIQADTAVSSDIYAGGEFLWKSAKGFDTRVADWTKLADTGAGHSITAVSATGGMGYAAWCGPCWPGYVSETGFKRGAIAKTDSGAWAPIALNGVPDRYISGFAVDPIDAKHAYLSLSGYARHWMIGPVDGNPGVGHVYETHDGGQNWTDISGDLVDAPASDIVLVGNRLVVATDVGVFESGTGGGTWQRVGPAPSAGGSLPNVIVADLHLTPADLTHAPMLVAATHGRGLWAVPVSQL